MDHLHSGRAVETPPQRDGRAPVGPKGWLDFLDDIGIEWTVMYPTVALSYGKNDREEIFNAIRDSAVTLGLDWSCQGKGRIDCRATLDML